MGVTCSYDEMQKRRPSSPIHQKTPDACLFTARIELSDHVVKKNSKTIRYRYTNKGRLSPYIGSTAKQTSAQDFLVLALQRRAAQLGLSEPFDFPMSAMFMFFYHPTQFFTVKGTGKRKPQTVKRNGKLPDLSNLYELPQDALTKAGIIVDDKLIRAHDGSRILPGDSTRLEIYLYHYDESKELAFYSEHLAR